RRSLSLGQRVHIGLPLDRQQALLARVAVLAGRHHVAAHRGAAAAERHDVIHRERLMADLAAAVVAESRRNPPLPPLAGAQLARPGALALELVGVDRRVVVTHVRPVRWRGSPTRAAAPSSAPPPPCARATPRARDRRRCTYAGSSAARRSPQCAARAPGS